MKPQDYALQISAYYFVCIWLISWGVLCAVGLVMWVVEKIKK